MKAFRLVFAVVVALLLATMSLASEAGVDGNDKKKDKKDDKDLMPVWVSAPEVKGKVSPQPAPNPPDPPKAPVDGNAVAAGACVCRSRNLLVAMYAVWYPHSHSFADPRRPLRCAQATRKPLCRRPSRRRSCRRR